MEKRSLSRDLIAPSSISNGSTGKRRGTVVMGREAMVLSLVERVETLVIFEEDILYGENG